MLTIGGKKINAISCDGKDVKKIATTDGKVIWQKSSLPDGYKECEYIENTTSAVIDTGFIPNTNSRYEVGFSKTSPNGSWNPIINNEMDIRFGIMCSSQSTNHFIAWIGKGSGTGTNSVFSQIDTNTEIVYNQKYDLILDKSGLSVDGTLYTFSSTPDSAEGKWPAVIGGRYLNAETFNTERTIGKYYYIKMYKDGILLRDYVPVYNISTSEYGLFDKVNQKFYGSANDNKFTGKLKE